MGERGRFRMGTQRRRVWLGQALGSVGSVLLAACADSGPRPTVPGQRSETASPAAAGDSGDHPAGRIVFVSKYNIHIWSNGTIRQLTNDGASRQPSWSPDGLFVAHVKVQNSSSDIWVMEAGGPKLWRLTYYGQQPLEYRRWAFRPRYWPRGDRLLFLSDDGTYDLRVWQLDLDGRPGRPLLRAPDGQGGLDHPSVSPDERRLLVTSYREEQPQVWTWGLPDGPWRQLTQAAEGAYDPAWSPDGTRVAYTQRQAGGHDVWIMGADGGGAVPVTTTGRARSPCWSPAGDALSYLSDDGAGFDVWVTPPPALGAATGDGTARDEPRRLTRGVAVDAVSGLSWAG